MIQTVTGGISKEKTDRILMHEHISCSCVSYVNAFGKAWLDKDKLKALAIQSLKLTKEKYNIGLMVDGTPIDLGRDASLLYEISKATGVKIVASTGFYYLQTVDTFSNSAGEIAELFINECENGIFGTGIKPGILKCATGNMGITEDNLKKLTAMSIVQSKTGLPLYVHCEHNGNIAFEQLDLLLRNGADADKIIIGHAALRPDEDYLECILKRGCYICMDQCFCYPDRLSKIAQSLSKLCEKGYSNKILISEDYCIHNDFCNNRSNGMQLPAEKHCENLGYIFDKLYNEYLSFGGKDSDWNKMLCQNPLDVLDVKAK